MSWIRRFAGVPILALALASGLASAQSTGTTTADLKGRVVDDKGQPLPGVTVTATNRDTGHSRFTVTHEDGGYTITLLPPGVYTVKSEVSLFAPAQYDNVRLTLGTTTSLNLPMKPAQASEVVVVTAEAPLIDPAKTDLSQAVTQVKIQALPNVARNFLSFSLTTPRVAEDRGQQTGAASSSGFSINGQSPRYNNLVVDGFDNNDQATGSIRSTFSQEAVQEYQVITNPYASEYGRTAGGVVNIVTRSGTNDFRGSAFYFYRSDDLAVEDPLTGDVIPLEDHRFGASIGGPFVKDKTFFFTAYERQTTETANAVTISDADVALIKSQGFTGVDNGNVPYDVRNNSVVLKIDHQLNANNYLTLRGNYSSGIDENSQTWGGLTARSAGGTRDSRDFAGALSATSIIGAHSFNEFRFLYSDADYETLSLDANRQVSVTLPGVAIFGTQRFLPQPRNLKLFQAFDAFSFEPGSGGNVRIKVGAEYTRNKFEGSLPNFFAGVYRFGALPPIPGLAPNGLTTRQAFAAGLPQVFFQGFGDPSGDGTSEQISGFVQADFTLGQLLLRVGARYDYENPVDPFESDSNNVAPRISFSWGPNEKIKIKGGLGRFYGVSAIGPMFAVQIQNGIQIRTKIRVFGTPATRPDLWPGCPIPGVIGRCPWQMTDRRFATEAAAAAVVPDVILRAGDFKSTYTDQASLGFESMVGTKILASVDAVYSRGKNILIARDINPITNPVARTRPNPAYSSIFLYDSIGQSWYYGGTLGLQTRIGGPLEFTAFYTYAKAEDDYIDWLTEFQPEDPLRPQRERGASVQSPDQKVSITGVYSTVGRGGSWFARDWTFSTIVDWKNGLHYNYTAGTDRNGNGEGLSDRPIDPATGDSVRRNAGVLGSQFSLDLRIARTIPFGASGVSAELIGTCTNVTNNENVLKRNDVAGVNIATPSQDFGKPTLYGPGRIFQLGARINF